MTDQKKEYHNIFVPAPDIYLSEGDEPFDSLRPDHDDERNLLVVPQRFLEDVKNQERAFPGANKAFFDRLRNYSAEQALTTDGKQPVPAEGGLEVLVVRGSEGRNLRGLKDYLDSRYVQTSERSQDPEVANRPQIISDDNAEAISYHASGMYVGVSEFTRVDEQIVRMGIREPDNPDSLLATLEQRGSEKSLPLEEAVDLMGEQLYMNQFVRLRSGEHSQYAQVVGDVTWNKRGSHMQVRNKRLSLLDQKEYSMQIKINGQKPVDGNVLGIKPRGMEQYLAMQKGLLDPDVRIMFLTGDHGTGKTLISYMSALHQTVIWDSPLRQKFGYVDDDSKGARYQQVALFKPPNEMRNRDIGYLPGSQDEKLLPHMQPFMQAHAFRDEKLGVRSAFVEAGLSFSDLKSGGHFKEKELPRSKKKGQVKKSKTDTVYEPAKKIQGRAYLPKHPVLVTPHIGFIRGINIPNSYVIVDETENLTPFEVKTLCGRVTGDTKLVFLGDPFQVDNPRNTTQRNGLTAAIKHFYDKDNTMLIHLSRNERSEISRQSLSMRAYQ